MNQFDILIFQYFLLLYMNFSIVNLFHLPFIVSRYWLLCIKTLTLSGVAHNTK